MTLKSMEIMKAVGSPFSGQRYVDYVVTEIVIPRLTKLFEDNGICKSHGIDHAIEVCGLAVDALEAYPGNDLNRQLLVKLAALLHDADDHKFFPGNKNYENARAILKDAIPYADTIEQVIKMIGWVSASANHDTVPEEAEPWMLVPRYADRLTAIGWTGIRRCWEYTLSQGRPLATPETKRVRTLAELEACASEERYKAYTGKSASMIDHYYDKLYQIGKGLEKCPNSRIRSMAKGRLATLAMVPLAYGKTGEVPEILFELSKELS